MTMGHCSTSSCFLIAILAFIVILAGCAETPESEPAPEREFTEHEAEGTVIRILDNSRLIQIAHGDIDGFMPAMTMPFEFRADSIRAAVAEGDSVHFRIASDGIDNWIVDVTVIE